MLFNVQNLYFAVEITFGAMKYFCMFFSKFVLTGRTFQSALPSYLLHAAGINCIIKHHEGKSLLTENTGSQNNHSSWLFGQSWWDADSPKIVQNAVFSVQNRVYCIQFIGYIQYSTVHIQHTIFIHELCAQILSYLLHWNLSYMRLIFTTVKNCHQK